MATIGTFTKSEDGSLSGAIKTLTLNVKASQFRPADKENDKAPTTGSSPGTPSSAPPGRRPPARTTTTSPSSWTIVEQLIDTRQVNHSTVAIQELMHTIGVLDPDDPRTAAVVEAVTGQIQAMPEHRVFTPDAEVLGRAALLAGILSRLQGYARDAKLKALQDCVLFLQAQKLGFAVLTANLAEFDLLLQLVPTGRVLFYRAGA